jgi:hypothetical protein
MSKMISMKKITAAFGLTLALIAFTSMKFNTGGNRKEESSISATLTGAAEIPGPGDPDGMGSFNATINQGQGSITYELTVSGIDPATAAHIHIGDPTVAGAVVVTLEAPTDGSSSGTITGIDPAIIKAIRKNPENYYVNVHNATYPAGAIRGQLYR